VIAATVAGSGMAAIDSTVVSIALPTIGREFHAPVTALQWVVTGYTLTLSALLLTAGNLGDRYGRRRMFTIGVVWFTVASAACAVAPGSTALIVLRVLQGVGGALLTPGSLAILQASFAQQERGRAIGAWTGLGGVASAAGPLLGGWLVTVASRRWIFIINFPVGVFVLVTSIRHVPESRDPGPHGPLDWPGAVLAVLALGGTTFALIEGPSGGWARAPVIGALVLGVAAGVGFVVTERRAADPTLPLGVFASRQFSVTNVVTFVVYAALGGILFLLPVTLQVVGGYSPLEAGVALLPLTLVMLVFSTPSGRLASRIGPHLQMSVGPVVIGAGLALLGRATSDTDYWTGVLPAVLVFAGGLAFTVAPLTATALGAVPDDHAGVASAVNNVVARVGGLVAVAVLPAVAGISTAGHLSSAELAAGFPTAARVAGGLCVAGGLVAAIGIRNPSGTTRRRRGHRRPGELGCALDAPPLYAGAAHPGDG
jgi:EmrB/QacA subfamily drug resistance transporter